MRVFVGLHRGGGFFGAGVRWLTWSPYGHASLRFGVGASDDLVFEADFDAGFVQRTRADKEGPVTWFEITDSLFPRQRIALLYAAVRMKGAKYDRWGVARFLPIVRLFYRGDAFSTRKRVFCSEAIILLAQSVGLHLLVRIAPHRVAPGDLAMSPYLVDAPDVA